MRFAVLLTSLIVLAACVSTPTLPAPLPTPSASRAAATVAAQAVTPGPGTPGPITITGVNKQTLPSGEIRTTARAAAEGNLGLGQIEASSPERMALGETRTVRLRISPATQLVSSTPVAVPVQTPGLPGFVYKFNGNVQLYPIMIAELRAVTFAMAPTGPQRRDIQSAIAVEWSWLVNAKSLGRQDLSIALTIPILVNGTVSEISTNPLQEIPLTIQVDPAPPPTPVPGSIWESAAKSIADNTGAIVVALIGLLGTVLAVLIKNRLDREHKKES